MIWIIVVIVLLVVCSAVSYYLGFYLNLVNFLTAIGSEMPDDYWLTDISKIDTLLLRWYKDKELGIERDPIKYQVPIYLYFSIPFTLALDDMAKLNDVVIEFEEVSFTDTYATLTIKDAIEIPKV